MSVLKAKFITFEGGEGSGKTTIIQELANVLREQGFDCIITREPGGGKISEAIRDIILDKKNTEMDARTEALLYAASRRQHLCEIILPALAEGKIVLCDRFLDSSLAYQGVGRNLGIQEVNKMNQFATDGLIPDITLYIDVDPEVGLQRIIDNNREQNRLDIEERAFHNKVREGYFTIANLYPNRIYVIDGNQSKEIVLQKVIEIVLKIV